MLKVKDPWNEVKKFPDIKLFPSKECLKHDYKQIKLVIVTYNHYEERPDQLRCTQFTRVSKYKSSTALVVDSVCSISVFSSI